MNRYVDVDAFVSSFYDRFVCNFETVVKTCQKGVIKNSVAAHLRSFFEKVGSLPRVFIVYICAHTFPR